MKGPNVKKLIAHKMSILAIPPGGGLADGVEFLMSKERVIQAAKEATAWVEDAIAVVKSAPDNPFKTDEEIADEILRRIEKERKWRRERA